MFLHLHPNPASILTFGKLTELLKPDFSVEGSTRRHFEDAVYTRFITYLVSVLNFGASSPGSSPGQRHGVVFLGETVYSHSASLHPGV